MPDVLIMHLNNTAEALVTTSLIKRFIKDGYSVHSVSDENAKNIFKFCGSNAMLLDGKPIKGQYDVAINMSPSYLSSEMMNTVSANHKLGYGIVDGNIEFLNDGAKRHYESSQLGIPTKANLFQLLFSLADMTWQGEGYALGYFPRNRSRKTLAGVAVKEARLRRFILNNLSLEKSRLWQIPFKKNILKHIDEVNRCRQIVTDDSTTLHVALALRKSVEYVVDRDPTFSVEMFGSGRILKYDINMVKYSSQEQNAT